MLSRQRDYWLIFALALVARLLAALPQTQPNYMDAAYYLVGGQQLAQGHGFNDPYVWNYLDQPRSLPHPSHLYWMPLPSLMVAMSQSLFGVNYRAAQIPFVLLSAALPVVTYAVARRLCASQRDAWLAALLTIFSAFYLPYWGVPESFAPFAVFGALALYWGTPLTPTLSPQGRGSVRSSLVLVGRGGWGEGQWRLLAAGACAGLAHLSRADGVLLLAALLLAQLRLTTVNTRRKIFILQPSAFVLVPVGYGLVMLPWFIRNLSVIGMPLSAVGSQAMWQCTYDELFAYGARFDLNHLVGCGLDRAMAAKVNGVLSGAVHWLAEVGMIFLAPLIVAGVWQKRREAALRAALMYAALLFVAMTLVFTFAGDRGGLFHSSGALLPFAYAAVPIGLETVIGWIAVRRRAWRASTARSVFGVALIGLAIGMSWMIYRGRVIGPDWQNPIWNQAGAVDQTIGQWLAERGAADAIVMVNNPPAFTYTTGLRSIVIPNGPVDDVLRAARQFGARWLVLDANRPAPLADLYANPAGEQRLLLRATFDGVYVLEVQPGE